MCEGISRSVCSNVYKGVCVRECACVSVQEKMCVRVCIFMHAERSLLHICLRNVNVPV